MAIVINVSCINNVTYRYVDFNGSNFIYCPKLRNTNERGKFFKIYGEKR